MNEQEIMLTTLVMIIAATCFALILRWFGHEDWRR